MDLGLSVKWATCNVGSSNPEEYGDYFAWGETKPKTTYNWNTYKYCFKSSRKKITKYNVDPKYGNQKYVDNDTVLNLSDDAASVNWGGSWRTPTLEEWRELKSNSIITIEKQNGVSGLKFTSRINGNSIFLVPGGLRGYKHSTPRFGWYWAADIYSNEPYRAAQFYFFAMDDISYIGEINWLYHDRCYGALIRPVCP